MSALERLKRRIPDAQDDDLLSDLLDQAEDFILNYTHRGTLPESLENAKIELAAIYFNRMGMEGETAHDEGGVSRTAQTLPDDIARCLNPARLAKTL